MKISHLGTFEEIYKRMFPPCLGLKRNLFVDIFFPQGKIVSCSRKAKTQSEAITSIYDAHYGQVRALQVILCIV
jgi:hypothetical protein